jgi:hypothetical protein
MEAINQKTRTAQVEHRRRVDLDVLIPAADALMLFRGLMETCRDILHDNLDEELASRIFCEVARRLQSLLPGPRTVIENKLDD